MKKLILVLILVAYPVICYSGISVITDVKLNFDISLSNKETEMSIYTDTLKDELYKEAYATLTSKLQDLNIIGKNNTGTYALTFVISILQVKEFKSYIYIVRTNLTCIGSDKIGRYTKKYWEKLHYGICPMTNISSPLKDRIDNDISSFADDWYKDRDTVETKPAAPEAAPSVNTLSTGTEKPTEY